MLFHTARLVIRNFKEEDLESFLAYRNHPGVARYQNWTVPYSRDRALAFIKEMKDLAAPKQGHWLQLALELKSTGEMIGDVAFRILAEDVRQAVIGYTIAPAHWRKGYALEALTSLLEYLFEDLDLHRVSADCDAENIASYRTLERLGFRREAHFIESFFSNGHYASEYYYGLLQREWKKARARSNAP